MNDLFCEGDKVVYPMYGAGVVEALEEQHIDGQTQVYYVLRIPVGNLRIMVAVENAVTKGIRRVLPAAELLAAIQCVCVRPVSMSENWNQRYRDNMEKIRSGDLVEAAEVFRNLRRRERDRGLSSAEKKMLTNVKQIILSEIILSHNVERDDAEVILENAADIAGEAI